MTATHQAILAELYEIDPGLREHETELVPLLQKLLATDPAQKPNAAFVKRLRKELQERVNAVGDDAIEHRISYAPPSSFFHRFVYALAGAAAAVVIAVPITLDYSKRHSPMPPASPETGDESPVAKSNGYDIADQSANMPSPDPVGNNPVTAMGYARTQSGGGGDTMSAVSSLIAPWNPVKYRLEGDLPELPQDEVEVLERIPGALNIPFANIQNAFKDTTIDLTPFSSLSVDNLSITQRVPFGYTINLSMMDGSISINQAWDQWPHPEASCQDEACYRKFQTTIGDIPSDADAIRIAKTWLDEHDIDLSGYGDPIVDNAWRRDYDRVKDKRYVWIPDSVRVVFPLLVDGKTVIEVGGKPAGVSIQVSVKHKRVSDAWGFTVYHFTHTNHPAVTERSDVEKFLSMAGSQAPDAPTIALKNPTIEFVRLYTYESGKNTELFVPALVFQVPAATSMQYELPQTIAVPLAKDLLDEAQPPMPIDPLPMPLEGGPAVDVPAKEAPTPPEPLMMEKPAR